MRDWDNGTSAGTSVEIEADSIGHDLTWGTSTFTRTVMVREDEPEEPKEVEPVAKVVVVEPENLTMPPTSKTPAPEPEIV